jgi:hypothetical protein
VNEDEDLLMPSQSYRLTVRNLGLQKLVRFARTLPVLSSDREV